MNKRAVSATLCLLLLGAAEPVLAQSLTALPLRNPRQLPEGYISVQSGISISFPLPDGDNQKQQEDALKTFYRIAASNCTVLLDTVAEACEITSMSSNTNANNLDSRGTRLTIGGQVIMSVKLRPTAAAAK
ncbi:MAG: hypothetical protein QM636_03010 [Rhizobium sp.]